MADFYSSNGIPTIFPYDTDFDLVPYTQNLQKHVYIDPCYKHLNEVFGESSSKHFVDTSTYVKNPLFNAFENLTDINISIPGAKEHKRQEQGTQEASSSSEDYHAVMPSDGVSDDPLHTSILSENYLLEGTSPNIIDNGNNNGFSSDTLANGCSSDFYDTFNRTGITFEDFYPDKNRIQKQKYIQTFVPI